jgi:hypothetical protein
MKILIFSDLKINSYTLSSCIYLIFSSMFSRHQNFSKPAIAFSYVDLFSLAMIDLAIITFGRKSFSSLFSLFADVVDVSAAPTILASIALTLTVLAPIALVPTALKIAFLCRIDLRIGAGSIMIFSKGAFLIFSRIVFASFASAMPSIIPIISVISVNVVSVIAS